MEATGIIVDRHHLETLSSIFGQRMAEREEAAIKLAGRPFNLGSPKQLGEILYDEMGIGGGKKTKTGAYATGAEVLEELAAQGHELPQVILDWRQLQKLTRTYTESLVEEIVPETGRVHTSYMMAATSTGRLSSTDPNLQNIPIRTEEGRRIRGAFVAADGHLLVSADYSQIELRVLAHMADIGALKEAFAKDTDIHSVTAARMFKVPESEVGSDLRRRAKTINYGIIYGIGAFGLAQRLGIPHAEAKAFIEAYFEEYPGRPGLHGAGQGRGARAGLRHDPLRPPLLRARDPRQAAEPALLCRAAGDQRADPGLGRGHHEARHAPGGTARSTRPISASACCSRSTTSWSSRCPRTGSKRRSRCSSR